MRWMRLLQQFSDLFACWRLMDIEWVSFEDFFGSDGCFGRKSGCRRREITLMWWAQITAWHPWHHRKQIKHQIQFACEGLLVPFFSNWNEKESCVWWTMACFICILMHFFSPTVFLSVHQDFSVALPGLSRLKACGVSLWQTASVHQHGVRKSWTCVNKKEIQTLICVCVCAHLWY